VLPAPTRGELDEPPLLLEDELPQAATPIVSARASPALRSLLVTRISLVLGKRSELQRQTPSDPPGSLLPACIEDVKKM
jgi:hypothetical protein